jgi:hypothetical protein
MQKIYYYYQKQLRSLSRTETVAQLEQKDVAKKNF